MLVYLGEIILPNWKPVKITEICSDTTKTVAEVLGQIRVPPTLKIQIRLVCVNKMYTLNYCIILIPFTKTVQ